MSKSHPRWRMAKRVLTVLFFIAVIVLLVIYAQKVDWQEVWEGDPRLPIVTAALFRTIALVIVSYLIYGCYDLSAGLLGTALAKRCDAGIVICYAFNLTLSTGFMACATGCARGWGSTAAPSPVFFH